MVYLLLANFPCNQMHLDERGTSNWETTLLMSQMGKGLYGKDTQWDFFSLIVMTLPTLTGIFIHHHQTICEWSHNGKGCI
jgi:hypothetical protein